jgi:hypothetical protein
MVPKTFGMVLWRYGATRTSKFIWMIKPIPATYELLTTNFTLQAPSLPLRAISYELTPPNFLLLHHQNR